MKKVFLLIFFVFETSITYSQGMFTEKGRFSVDVGVGFVGSDDFDALSYNLSTSVLGIIDLGMRYFKAFPSKTFKRAEGGGGYLNFYAKKDTSFGLVLNTAFSTINYESAFLAGLSIYGKLNSENSSSFNFFPYLSLGYITTANLAIGFGLPVESKLSKNYSIILTPAVNTDTEVSQYILALELIIKP